MATMSTDVTSEISPTERIPRLFRLDGKIAIVTGASAGLGERFVRVLHEAGARVVAAARRRERLESLAGELGTRVVPIACDVTIDAQVDSLVARAAEEGGGRIDVLVNNAGISKVVEAEADTREVASQEAE